MPNLHSFAQSATLARRVGVVVGSVLWTLYFCCLVLWLALLRRLDRQRVDGFTRAWSRGLLRLVRVRLSVHGQCRISMMAGAT